MNKIFELGKIADLNIASLKSDDNYNFINYLDTSSITKNKIEAFQLLADNFPSRAKRKIKKNTIVYSTVRPNQKHYGIFEKIDFSKNIIVSTGFTTIDVKSKEVDSKYLYYKLIQDTITDYLQTIGENSVSAYPSINPSDLAKLKFKFPDIDEQRKISYILSALDVKIELNNRINAELEAMAKTIYDYWFVQFDFPDKNGKPYKTSSGKMVWNDELKREIPEGWGVSNFATIANITTGKLDSNAEEINGEFHFYTCAADPSRTSTYAFDNDVILIAGNNASGNFHINRYKGKFNAYQRTYIITAKNKSDFEYMYQVLKTSTKSFKTRGNGSQTKFITIGMLTGIRIYSECSTIEKYFEIVNPFHEKQVILQKENQQLSNLRDWLLPMLMNGQVTVCKAYEQVEEVLGMVAEDEKGYKK